MEHSADSTFANKNVGLRVPGSRRKRRWGAFRQNSIRFRDLRAKRALLILAVVAGTWGSMGCEKKVFVSVPDVVKQDLDQAKKTLAAVPLTPGVISGSTGTGAYVTAQNPTVGQQVAANSKVDLSVEMPIVVPTLKGLNISDAVIMLQGLDLKVAFVKQPSVNPFGKAKVEQQDPAPNSPVHHGAVVTLTVSRPPDIQALLGLVANEPAYKNLKPEYKSFLDAFLGNPSTSRSMEPQDAPSGTAAPNGPTK